MKKITTFVWSILCMIMAFTSCTNDTDVEEFKVPVADAPQEITMHRSLSEAIQIAKNAPAMIGGQSRSANTNRAIDLSSIACLTAGGPKSRAVENDDTLLYILNYADGNGFAIVSASNATTGLLGITESGRYGTSEVEENNGIQMFINSAKRYVQNAVADSITRMAMAASNPQVQTVIVRDTVPTSVMLPRLQVNWEQEGVFSKYALNSVTKEAGCGIIAAAMAMSCMARTQSISLTFPGAPYPVLPLPWTLLNKHGNPSYDGCTSCTDTSHDILGLLCRQLAQLSHATFNANSTGTTMINLNEALQDCNMFVSDIEDYYHEAVQENIGDGVVLISGFNNLGEGHAWLSDGYLCFDIHTYLFVSTNYGVTWSLFGQQSDSYTFNHYNWGYKGNCNGYFLSGIFDLGLGIYHTPPTWTHPDYNFYNNVNFFSIW